MKISQQVYAKELADICRHLKSLHLLKNVSILGQPPILGTILGAVMKTHPVTIEPGASSDDQIRYVLAWWAEVKKNKRRNPRS